MIDIIGTLRRLITTIGTPVDTDISTDIANVQIVVDGIPTTAMRGTDSATLQATWTDAMATALINYTAARAGFLDELAAANLPTDISTIGTAVNGIQTDLNNAIDGLGALKTLLDAITPAGPTLTQMNTAHGLLATEVKEDIISTNVDQIEVLVDSKVMGRMQVAVESLDLDSLGIDTYVILTGTTQDVILESLIFYTTRSLAADSGFTGISLQTNDTTAQVFISQSNGVKGNLTAERQIAWTGAVLLKTGQTIGLNIYGGAVASVESLCDVVVEYRAVVSGGYLDPA
jgi:hypothetical protein